MKTLLLIGVFQEAAEKQVEQSPDIMNTTDGRECVKTHWIPPGLSRVEIQLEPKPAANSLLDTTGFSRVEFQF